MTTGHPPRPERLRARRFGRWGEWVAGVSVRLRGYRVLARNFRVPAGEIDLIISRGQTIAFVEVKARPDVDTARTAIMLRQRRRISRAAAAWLRRNDWACRRNLRADAIYVTRLGWPQHLENIFELDLFASATRES